MPKAEHQVPDSRPWFKLYGENIKKHLDYPDVPLFYFLDEAAAEHPDKIAMSFYGNNITYKQYKELADKFSHALLVNGVGKGDRVMIMAVNCPQTLIATIGAMKAGAIAVPLNPSYSIKELEYFFKDLTPKLVVTLDNFCGNVATAARVTPEIERIVSTNISDYYPPLKRFMDRFLKKVDVYNCHESIDFSNFIAMAPTYEEKDNIRKEEELTKIKIDPEEDIALIVYSERDVGEPKGVALTHSNIVANVLAIEEWFKNVSIDSLLLAVPMFRICGSGLISNFCDSKARKLLVFPNFDIDEVIKVLQKEKNEGLFCVPAIYSALINHYHEHPEEPKLTEVSLCGGEKVPISLNIREKMKGIVPHAFIVEGYGLAETCSPIMVHPIAEGYQRKPGSIGVPCSDIDAKIVDLETGEELPPNSSGEIAVRGPSIFKEYWNNPEEIKRVLRDGWFYTGDIGHMDDNGIFYIEKLKNQQ